MPYAFVQDVPITMEIYEEIVPGLGNEPPEGLIVHVTQVLDDGRLRYLDIWETQDDCDRFVRERLHPVVGPVLARHQIRPEREPERQSVLIADVWAGAAAQSNKSTRPQSATRG